MPQDYFQQRKKSILLKKDKSSIGEWDKKIIPLCNNINKFPQYYTTSSCSGRIVLMIDQNKKAENLFIKQYHEKISFNQLRKDLERIIKDKKLLKKLIKFKQEPMILHIACYNLEDATYLMKIAQTKAGFKKTGIIAIDKRIILEINSSEKIEFPIINKGKILVGDNFLKLIIKKSNMNLEKNWLKIKILQKLI